MSFTHRLAVIGGTFDHLHLGHKHFITKSLELAQQLIIGLTQTNLLGAKRYSQTIENYSKRLANLQAFIAHEHLSGRVRIVPIDDIYGPTLTDKEIGAIFVTKGTEGGAHKINLARQASNLSPLQIVVLPYLSGDDSQVISSSRIRAGEIDVQGHSYAKFFASLSTTTLPPTLRNRLQQPLGQVLLDANSARALITPLSMITSVGDIVTMDLIRAGLPPTIGIVDYYTRRERLSESLINQYFANISARITNPAGTINPEIATTLDSVLKQYERTRLPQIIAVDGEEDLLALPAMLFAPLDSYLIYGQYQVGMCLVQVTPEIKSLAKTLLSEFI